MGCRLMELDVGGHGLSHGKRAVGDGAAESASLLERLLWSGYEGRRHQGSRI